MSGLVLTRDPIDPRSLEARVEDPSCGAVVTFQGTVRDHHEGRDVLGLEYEAWRELALAEHGRIVEEITRRYPGVRLAAAHRLGSLAVGEVSIVVATAAPHRREAYGASVDFMDALKARLPVWKRERYADGTQCWVANAEFQGEEPK